MLIHCPECGKEVSDSAVLCPYCGYLLNNMPAGQVSPYPNQYQNQTPNPYAGQYQNPTPNPYPNQYQNPTQSPYPNQYQASTPTPYQNPAPNPYPNQYQAPAAKPRVPRKKLFFGIAASVIVVAVAIVLIVILGGGKYYRGITWNMSMEEIALKEQGNVASMSNNTLKILVERKPDSNFVDPNAFEERRIRYYFEEKEGKTVLYRQEIYLKYKNSNRSKQKEDYLAYAKTKWDEDLIETKGNNILIKAKEGYIVIKFYDSHANMHIYSPENEKNALQCFSY